MPQESEVFFKLARGLSDEERRELLAKINITPQVEGEALLPVAPEEDEANSIEVAYSRMGLFHRLFLYIKSLLTRRDVHDLVADEILNAVGRRIAQQYPGMYDHRQETLGFEFLRELDRLRARLGMFVEPMKEAFGGDRREFLGFLGSIVLPAESEALAKACDPMSLSDANRDSEFQVRKQVQIAIRDAMGNIDQESRTHLYTMYRALFFLNELVSFPFARITGGEGEPVAEVPASKHRSDLNELGDILVSLGVRPTEAAIAAVLMYERQDRMDEDGFAKELELRMERSADALDEIARFCRSVPLVDMLKSLNRNPGYRPERVGGGEDWFTVFRQYWENRAEENVEQFVFGERIREYQESLRRLFSREKLLLPERYCAYDEHPTLRIRYPRSITLLLSFAELIFTAKYSRVVKVFLVNGEFYKAQNRAEMTDAVNGLSSLADSIRGVDRSLSDDGELGSQIVDVEGRLTNGVERGAKIQKILDRADKSMETIIGKGLGYLDTSIKVINGILHGESGGAYDTLSNLTEIGATENRILRERLKAALETFNDTKQLLRRIFELESGQEVI